MRAREGPVEMQTWGRWLLNCKLVQSLYTALDTVIQRKRLKPWKQTAAPETDTRTQFLWKIPSTLVIISPNHAPRLTTAITCPTMNRIPARPKSAKSSHSPSMPSFTGLHRSLLTASRYHFPCKSAGQSEQFSNPPVIVKSSCPSVTQADTEIEARASTKATSIASRRDSGSRSLHNFFTGVASCIIGVERVSLGGRRIYAVLRREG